MLDNPSVQEAILQKDPAVVQHLIQLLYEKNALQTIETAQKILIAMGPAIVPALLDSLKPSKEIADNLAAYVIETDFMKKILFVLGEIGAKYELHEAAKRLIYLLNDQGFKEWYTVYEDTSNALGKFGSWAIPYLVRGLRHNNENVKRYCARAIDQHLDRCEIPEALEPLAAMLASTKKEHNSAFTPLSKFGPSAIPRLMEGTGLDDYYRAADFVRVIGNIAEKHLIPDLAEQLEPLLRHPSDMVRKSAVHAIEKARKKSNQPINVEQMLVTLLFEPSIFNHFRNDLFLLLLNQGDVRLEKMLFVIALEDIRDAPMNVAGSRIGNELKLPEIKAICLEIEEIVTRVSPDRTAAARLKLAKIYGVAYERANENNRSCVLGGGELNEPPRPSRGRVFREPDKTRRVVN